MEEEVTEGSTCLHQSLSHGLLLVDRDRCELLYDGHVIGHENGKDIIVQLIWENNRFLRQSISDTRGKGKGRVKVKAKGKGKGKGG